MTDSKLHFTQEKNPPDKRVLVITGPTASGKTHIAESIARNDDYSIISADSRQVYKFLSIGTAKPLGDAGVKYHLIDFLHPRDRYSAAQFIDNADSILDNEKAIICGGTGFYIRALTEGIFEGDYRSQELRDKLSLNPSSDLYHRLSEVDPTAAAGIHPNNKVRIIRALEVYLLSGKPISVHWEESRMKASRRKFLKIGISHPRDELRDRILRRTKQMIDMGWVNEVEELLNRGFDTKLPGMNSLGYPLVIDHINGLIGIDSLIDRIFHETWQYARRQLVWLKKEPGLIWVDYESAGERIEEIRNSPST